MILVSVGTERYPFDRLVSAIDAAADRFGDEEVLIQLGHSRYRPQRCAWAAMLPYPDLTARIREARVVITHAGAGLILLCLQAGRTPIVLPRRRRYGEHVDDHQVELAERLADAGRIVLAESAEAIPDLAARHTPAGTERLVLGASAAALSSAIDRMIEEQLALRRGP